jgi:peptidoglycan/xylan/chitin deacetylase (PgdA/CDA1 family)
MQFVKRLIKLIFSAIVFYSGALAVYHFAKKIFNAEGKFVILTYHRVLDDDEKMKAVTQPGMCVTRSSFDKQMKFLSRHYRILSFGQLVKLIKDGSPIPHQSAVVTFDDGWYDNYTNAFPVLTKYKIPAIIFIGTDMIETGQIPAFIEVSMMLGEASLWPQKAVEIFRNVVRENNLQRSNPKLDDYRMNLIDKDSTFFMRTLMLLDTKYIKIIADEMRNTRTANYGKSGNQRWMMNWNEIKEMSQHGIDFGSHGKTHDLLIYLSKDRVAEELTESKKAIEANLGQPVDFFSYPNHDHNIDVRRLVGETGYLGAGAGYNKSEGDSQLDPYALGRYNVNEGAMIGPLGQFSVSIFAQKLTGKMIG